MTSKSDIECELEKNATDLAMTKARLEAIAQERGAARDRIELATAALRAQIEAIQGPITAEIALLDQEQKTLEQRKCTADWRTVTLKAQVEAYDLTGVKTGEDAKAILVAAGVWYAPRMVFSVVKHLANDIVIVRCQEGTNASDALAVSYFAFMGRKVVGFQFTQKSRHPGDEASYWAWVSVPQLRQQNQVLADIQSRGWTDIKKVAHNYQALQYKQWKAVLEADREPQLYTTLDLSDPITREVLREDYSISSPRGNDQMTTWRDHLASSPDQRVVLVIPPEVD